ncbi:MAG: LamG domain-containing protein, partial [Deltaproteobacteria bacterium]
MKKQSDNKSIFQLNRVLPFTTGTTNPSANLSDGLIAYYPFNANYLNFSSNKHTGSSQNQLSQAKDRFNTDNNAFSFNDANYIEILNDPELQLTDNFTLSAWIRPTESLSNSPTLQGIISKFQKVSANGYILRLHDNSPRFAAASAPACSMRKVQEKNWQLLTATYTGSSAKVYLNGNLLCEQSTTVGNSTDKITIGNSYTVGGSVEDRGFRGDIDDVMIYNRALSQDEIQAIINVGDALPPLVGSVLINNGADNTTTDTLTLTLTSRDASPIVAYQVTDNGSFAGLPWRSDNLTPSDNVSFNTDFTLSSSLYGERQIQVRFQDQAGNISQPFSDNITRLDTTPPQALSFSLLGTADNDNFTNSASVSFVAGATDDVVTVDMYLSENSTTPLDNASGWQAYANTGTFQLSAGQGEKQVYLWFKDAAQNISGFLTDNITFDNVSPTANSLLINNGADNTTSAMVTLSFDNVTGASHYFATDNSSASTPAALGTGWHAYPASSSDNFTLTGTGMREVQV